MCQKHPQHLFLLFILVLCLKHSKSFHASEIPYVLKYVYHVFLNNFSMYSALNTLNHIFRANEIPSEN